MRISELHTVEGVRHASFGDLRQLVRATEKGMVKASTSVVEMEETEHGVLCKSKYVVLVPWQNIKYVTYEQEPKKRDATRNSA